MVTARVRAMALILQAAIIRAIVMIKVIIIPDTQINLDTGVMAGLITVINPTIITIRIIITTARSTQIIHSLFMAAINKAARLIALGITTTAIKIGAVGKTATTNHRNLGHLLWAAIIKVGKIPLPIGMDRPAAGHIKEIALTTNLTGEAGKAKMQVKATIIKTGAAHISNIIRHSPPRHTKMADIQIRPA